jgi:nucleotide-binding universal stress UspA family protein
MERIRRILCATQRGHEASEAVAQTEALARTHGAETAFLALAPGESASVVLRKAQSFEADLVVADAAEPGAPGSALVESLVRHAPCAVLAARPSPRTGNVLVASDLLDPSLPAVAAAVDEANRRHGSILLVHNVDTRFSGPGWGILTTLIGIVSDGLVAEVQGAARSRTAAALARFGAKGETVLAHGAAAASVLRLAGTLPAELVVIGSPGESSLRAVLFGSVVETIVHWAPCSVLVVPVLVAAPGARG